MRHKFEVLGLCVIAVLFCGVAASCSKGAKTASARSLIEAAETQAAAEGKAVFVHFSSSG